MCPTVLGRVQTRSAILLVPALIATIVSLVTGNAGWIVTIGLFFVIGVALDTAFYPFVISWQPPWLTFVLALGEFGLVYVAAHFLKVHLTDLDAVVLYWVAWVIAISTRIVVLPLLSLSWIENGGEFRATGWSVAPEYQPLPVSAFTPQQAGAGPPPLARKFSAAVIDIPEELRQLPGPSGVHRVPTGAHPSG